jgi:hypothetical protein
METLLIILISGVVILGGYYLLFKKSKNKKDQLPIENPEVELPPVSTTPIVGACYSYKNTTDQNQPVEYTSCLSNQVITSYVDPGLKITFCAVYGTNITVPQGVIGGLCNDWNQACIDDSDCSSCGSRTNPTLLAKKVQKKK